MSIDDENQARRLAKAICADVLLYNGAAREAAPGERAGLISGPVNEGRELFRSRVSARLASLYEQEVAAMICAPLGIDLAAVGATGVPPAAPGPAAQGPVVIADSGGKGGLLIAVALVLAAIAGAVFLFAR